MDTVRDGLESRRAALQERVFQNHRSEVASKAFAVLQYQLEGVDDVLRHLIAGDLAAAAEQQAMGSAGQPPLQFVEWASQQTAKARQVMDEHWRGRLTRQEFSELLQWLQDLDRLVDDVARLP